MYILGDVDQGQIVGMQQALLSLLEVDKRIRDQVGCFTSKTKEVPTVTLPPAPPIVSKPSTPPTIAPSTSTLPPAPSYPASQPSYPTTSEPSYPPPVVQQPVYIRPTVAVPTVQAQRSFSPPTRPPGIGPSPSSAQFVKPSGAQPAKPTTAPTTAITLATKPTTAITTTTPPSTVSFGFVDRHPIGEPIGGSFGDIMGDTDQAQIVAMQQDLLQKLQNQAIQRGQERAMIIQQQETDKLLWDPRTQTVYKWSGPGLSKMASYTGGGLGGILRKAWDATWGQIFSPSYWKGQAKQTEGLGVSQYAKDPWGVKTYNMPVSMRQEIELEEEFAKVHKAYAPYADEYLKGVDNVKPYVFRVFRMAMEKKGVAHYAVPYLDKFGILQLATGQNHPHLAVEQFQHLLKTGQVSKPVSDFDEGRFGYDMKLFMYSPSI